MTSSPAQRRRAARHQLAVTADERPSRRGPSGGRKKPITVDAIVDAALGIVQHEGFDALTMRRVASTLETGPASLYAHVVNKDDLDDLLIGRLCAEIVLPQPDCAQWREQILSVCAQLREQYLRYPGMSRAALAIVPTNTETLRVSEGMLGIMLAGGIDPRTAAWAIDALLLYVNAFCLETSLLQRHAGDEGFAVSRDDMLRRFASLPDEFPNTKRYAAEMTSGTPSDRFAFTVRMLLDGLSAAPPTARP